jgi:hypothetical protein
MSRAAHAVKLPPSLEIAASKLAQQDGLSLSQWVSIAVEQKISFVETAEAFFKRRAQSVAPAEFLEILRSAPDRPAESGDEQEVA